MDYLPSTLAALVSDLEARGFKVVECAPGNELWRETILRGPGPVAAVRLFRERGLWGVDLSLEEEYYNPYDVLLALDSAEYKARALSHAERRAMTLEALDRMPSDAGAISELRARLRRRCCLRDAPTQE